jgi:RecA/RadA recombinase
MQPHLSTYPIHPIIPIALRKATQTWKPELVITSGITDLDRLLGGFKAGHLTLIDGNSSLITQIPYRLCINTYQTFHSDTIYIDGGMAANPYSIAQYARLRELNQQHILSRVHISRAFTVYQLATIIQDRLETIIQQQHPRTLLIGMFPALYLDPDITPHEAQTLLKHNLAHLTRLASRYNLVTILTHRDRTFIPLRRNLRKIIYTTMHEIVRLQQVNQDVRIDLVKQHCSTTIRAISPEQRCLEDYMGSYTTA